MKFLHDLLIFWFQVVHDWGYGGIFFLMALESSIVPVPSEVVMPPAAFWAAQGKMDFWMVVSMGTAGSYFGSIVSYLVSRYAGAPIVTLVVARYGRYLFLNQEKLNMAQAWILRYGSMGIFFARLLPVVRHLVSIPAGVFKMKVWPFSVATIVGAGLWCTILSWYGQEVIGGNPELLNSPAEMVQVMKDKLLWFVFGVLALGGAYAIVMIFSRSIRKNRENRES